MKIIFLLTWPIFTNQLFAMYNKPPRQQPCKPPRTCEPVQKPKCSPISNTVLPNVLHCGNKAPLPQTPQDPAILPQDPHVSTPSPSK